MYSSENPVISVVVYVKNAASMIERAIQSVLDQSYSAIELIVIDGKSTDGTIDILENYNESISKLVIEPDEGPVFAANKGLSLATGDIIVLLMSDDWLEENALLKISNAFKENPDAEIISSGTQIVKETSPGIFATMIKRSGHENSLTLENMLGIPFTAARYFKRDLISKAGLQNTDYPTSHDRDWFMRCYLSNVCSAVIPDNLYTYRQHQNSQTLGDNPNSIRKFLIEHISMAKNWLKLATQSHEHKKIRQWRREQIAELILLDLRIKGNTSALKSDIQYLGADLQSILILLKKLLCHLWIKVFRSS